MAGPSNLHVISSYLGAYVYLLIDRRKAMRIYSGTKAEQQKEQHRI